MDEKVDLPTLSKVADGATTTKAVYVPIAKEARESRAAIPTLEELAQNADIRTQANVTDALTMAEQNHTLAMKYKAQRDELKEALDLIIDIVDGADAVDVMDALRDIKANAEEVLAKQLP